MKSLKKAQGITLIGFVFVLAVLGFFLFAGMQIVPVYMDHASVVKAMKAEAAESSGKSPNEIKKSLGFRLGVSYVTEVKSSDFKIVRGNGRELQVKYEVKRPFLYNLSFVMEFAETVQLD
ncbi:DUF4845 domain-containing protein [Marinicella litoralis]|uniref:Uncharacterized protein DUF4845 n=1 Tax=Marinicella litoralis TaxID=644220 RepID=A0A4R6XEW2_9GAMM|nr:DUF4845 domain-containing protein [Marinicella litoralis]TDR16290.1 uncharacterized protein DUF4845 [Marinicella litoralis]